jgi:hypothetical protein
LPSLFEGFSQTPFGFFLKQWININGSELEELLTIIPVFCPKKLFE